MCPMWRLLSDTFPKTYTSAPCGLRWHQTVFCMMVQEKSPQRRTEDWSTKLEFESDSVVLPEMAIQGAGCTGQEGDEGPCEMSGGGLILCEHSAFTPAASQSWETSFLHLSSSLRLLLCRWHDCRSFGCFLEVWRRWRALAAVLQVISQQFVCLWVVARGSMLGSRERPGGTGWEGVLLMREKAFPGSVLGKVLSFQTYFGLFQTNHPCKQINCTVFGLTSTFNFPQDSQTPLSIEFLGEFHFNPCRDEWLEPALHHSRLL